MREWASGRAPLELMPSLALVPRCKTFVSECMDTTSELASIQCCEPPSSPPACFGPVCSGGTYEPIRYLHRKESVCQHIGCTAPLRISHLVSVSGAFSGDEDVTALQAAVECAAHTS